MAQALAVTWAVAVAMPAAATDLDRGARLYATPPAPGLLACLDCHSEDPLTTNFGNIFVGRNAAALIQRAVNSNTGGMGYFRGFYDDAALADIAAWLGNAPSRVDFGEWPPGQASDGRSVTVRAGSKAAVPNLRFDVGGDFRLVANDCPTTLAPRGACQVQLAFVPTTGGERQGWLAIAHDALPTPALVTLVGRGRDRPPAVATLWPPGIDFGPVPTGAPGPARGLVLSNASVEPLTLSAVELDPALEVLGGSCRAGLVLGPGQRCELSLRWRAPGLGPLAASVRLTHDGAGGASELAVRADGVAAAGPRLVADAEALDFGSQPLGTSSAPQPLTLTAAAAGSSEATVQITDIAVEPPGFAAAGGSCRAGLRLAGGERCTLQLVHAPWRGGRSSGQVSVRVAGGAAPLRVPVQGFGIGSDATSALRLQPKRIDWRAAVGQAVRRHAWVLNDGTVALALGAPVVDGVDAVDWSLADPSGPVSTAADPACREGLTLPPGGRCEVVLQAQAAPAGRRTARLQWRHGGGALSLALQGQVGPGPWVEVDAVRLSGSPGTPAPRVTLRNPSPVPVRWAAWQAVGSGAEAFAIGGSCTQQPELAPGATCQIEIGPGLAPGAATASLPLVDSRAGVLALLTLQWEAEAGSATTVATPGWQALGPAASGAVGEPAARQRLRWVNPGPEPATVGRLAVDGRHGLDFSIDGGPGCRAGLVLPAGGACDLTVAFHPSTAGDRHARLRMAVGDGWATLPLAGQALGLALPRAHLDPEAVLLVVNPLAERPGQRVRLSNAGAAALWLGAAEASAHFPMQTDKSTEGCPTEGLLLLPGQACTVDLGWDGSAAGAAGGMWRWSSPDGQAPPSALVVAVIDDPAARRNVGAGAGLTGLAPWVEAALALGLLAIGWRHRRPRR